MKNLKQLIATLIVLPLFGADNEIFVEQAGATANIDLEQLGSSNIIGGLNSIAGTLTALDLDGINLTLDINQIGNTNKFLGDIYGDNITGFFEFDGDSNTFTIQADPTDTYGISGSDYNVDVTGSSNTFTLDTGTSALSENLDLDWIINGDSNTFDFDINFSYSELVIFFAKFFCILFDFDKRLLNLSYSFLVLILPINSMILNKEYPQN